MNDTIFGLLVGIAQQKDVSFNNCFLFLKFIANLFHQSILYRLILQYQRRILQVVSFQVAAATGATGAPYSQENITKILATVSQILINFSSLWCTHGHGKDQKLYKMARDYALHTINTILFDHNEKEDVVFECLVSLGTILQQNNSVSISLPNTFQKFLQSENPKISKLQITS